MYYPTSQMKEQILRNEESCSRPRSHKTGLFKLKIQVHSIMLYFVPNLRRGAQSQNLHSE